jgi:hypothetical protein
MWSVLQCHFLSPQKGYHADIIRYNDRSSPAHQGIADDILKHCEEIGQVFFIYYCANFSNLLSNVTVRGKCSTCTALMEARQQCANTNSTRKDASTLVARHKVCFMSERRAYAERRKQAREHPNDYVSIISDGMAQGHCLLPYYGNQDTFSCPSPQHFQGEYPYF